MMKEEHLKQFILKNIATLCFVGYIPIAPGTFGSLVAMLIFASLKPGNTAAISLLLFTVLIGTFSAQQAEKLMNEKDSRHIVIDEFAGYAVSVLFLPPVTSYYITAFLLFRFFDILKPPPIRNVERILSGGIGIMADDVMAGVFTNALLQIWKILTQN
ncbi:MAG TPA: phosphatidylglycerophosphatase A [Nitrospiraceae bacterium]|jgi:phosphatidylglycerophosphatase A|nr:phosphatidylglycerophosphatase A [Nitrospiraceae bacterium]